MNRGGGDIFFFVLYVLDECLQDFTFYGVVSLFYDLLVVFFEEVHEVVKHFFVVS